MENVVYYGLKGNWRINKTYGYYLEFKKAVLVMEGGFLFFFFFLPFERNKILILN